MEEKEEEEGNTIGSTLMHPELWSFSKLTSLLAFIGNHLAPVRLHSILALGFFYHLFQVIKAKVCQVIFLGNTIKATIQVQILSEIIELVGTSFLYMYTRQKHYYV